MTHLKHHIMFYFVLFLLCMISFVSCGLKQDHGNKMITRSCIENERKTLLLVKADLVDTQDVLYNWKEKSDCCEWVGVLCNNLTRHVIELDLSSSPNSLSGKLSPSLPLLRQLQYLDLSGIDFQLGFIPISFTSLTMLQHLDVSASNLSGPIPKQLGNLSKLLHLDLSRNFLQGSVPSALRDLTSLTHLDLSGNLLQGVIPYTFGNWSSLVLLNLSHNLLNGSVPNFSGCSSTKELFLHRYSILYRRVRRVPNYTTCSSTSNASLVHNSSNGSINPDCIRCPSLQMLDLSSNRLTGNLPESVGKLSNLEHLDVSSNSLKGVISDVHLLNLSYLTYLDLSFNSLALDFRSHGKISFQLKTIKMQSCNLGPSFPMWIQTQRDYANLDISNAGISDNAPAWFWDLPRGLKFLNISSNEIKGALPNITSAFERYPGMDLSYNQLQGTIPLLPSKLAALNLSRNRFSGTLSFLCLIDGALTFLDLSNNLLSGVLPDCWLKFQEKLVVLNLSNNNLSGEIPSSLGFLSQLQALYLRKNAFVGELPLSLGNCTKLRFVDLGENKFSGNIPAWIGERLSELYVLVLRSNTLYGSLPSQICWLSSLQFLDLSNNVLLGNIPRCFSNFTAMARRGFKDDIKNHSYNSYVATLPGIKQNRDSITYAALYRSNELFCTGESGRYVSCGSNEEAIFIDNALVAWKGSEREFGRGLHLLKSIDLSSNELSGKLPNEITTLVELVSLNFSINKLHGEIPEDMGRLISLDSLDLSRNEFSGKIPSSLSRVASLSYLDLSNNNLSGRIPTGTQLQGFNPSFYRGNPLLCGLPLTNKCLLPSGTFDDDDGKDGHEFWKSYYISICSGFAVGFWGICGTIFLNRRCRHLLFGWLSHMNDWIYVTVVVYFKKLQRKFTR